MLFYSSLNSVRERYKFEAKDIWNVDETGFTAVHKPARSLAKCGSKQVGRITSGENGVTTTAICAVNAAGVYIPPYVDLQKEEDD